MADLDRVEQLNKNIARYATNPELAGKQVSEVVGILQESAEEGGGGGGPAEWGGITGTLSDQTDLSTALTSKIVYGSRDIVLDINNNGPLALPDGTKLYFPYETEITKLRAFVYHSDNDEDIIGASVDGDSDGGVVELRKGEDDYITGGVEFSATPTTNNIITAGSYYALRIQHSDDQAYGGQVLVSIEYTAHQTDIDDE